MTAVTDSDLNVYFTKQCDAFGITVVGTSGVEDVFIRNTCTKMMELLDNNENGVVDDSQVVDAAKLGLFTMWPSDSDF